MSFHSRELLLETMLLAVEGQVVFRAVMLKPLYHFRPLTPTSHKLL
jgi:hypothetical protein